MSDSSISITDPKIMSQTEFMVAISLSQEFTNDITSFIFLEENSSSTDVAIVLGIKSWWLPVEKMVQMYESKLAERFIVSGGVVQQHGYNEAQLIFQAAIKRGIPKNAILLEEKSNNTLENMQYSLEILQKSDYWGKVNSISIVAIHFHSRRVLMTAQKIIPNYINIQIECYSSALYSNQNWHDVERGREAVLSELTKIHKYFN